MTDRELGSNLIHYHSCIKNGDVITIRARVVKTDRRGDIVTLHAHGQNCGKAKVR